jgi:heat shock protein HslJ
MHVRRTLRFALGFALLLVTSACANVAGPSASVPITTGDPRIGGTWTLITQQPAGEAEATPPAGTQFTFEVVDGRASLRVDCNRCNGGVTLDTGRVTLGPVLACTRAFCAASAAFGDRFVDLAVGESTIALEGDVLVLRSERGTLRLRK